MAARKQFCPVFCSAMPCDVLSARWCVWPRPRLARAVVADGAASAGTQSPGQTARSSSALNSRAIAASAARRCRRASSPGPAIPTTKTRLRRDFQALWNTQYFEDIRLEVQDSPNRPNAKIVIFHVVERPIIRRIEYQGNKSISESDILDAFKDRKVGLSVESQFDPTKIKKAEVVLKELEAEHGHQFADGQAHLRENPRHQRRQAHLHHRRRPEGQGRHDHLSRATTRFSDRKIHPLDAAIRGRTRFPLWLLRRIPVLAKTFDRAKLDEDMEIGIRGLYQNNGYFKVVVKDPILKTVDVNQGGLPGPFPFR